MSTLKEAYHQWFLNRDLNWSYEKEAFRAGARWVIDQLDAADDGLPDSISKHFAELNRLRKEVRSGE